MIKEYANNLLLLFVFLLGKLPVWAFLAAYLIYAKISFQAAVPFFFAIILARGLIYRWEYGRGIAYSTLRSLWKSFLRPILFFIIFNISCLALVYLFNAGEMLDWQIALAALAAAVCAVAAKMLERKPHLKRRKSFFPQGCMVKITITALWIYVLVAPDGYHLAMGAFILIYLLEFLTTFGIEQGMLLDGVK